MPKPPTSFKQLRSSIADSTCIVIIIPSDDFDAKISVELGVAVLLGKPIIAVIRPGVTVSEKLAKLVDRFIELDPADHRRCTAAITKAVKEIGLQPNGK